MNAALRRYSVGELQGLLDSGGMEAFTVNVSDRFGDYGLVGLVMFREHDDSVSIDNFLLSCRALGRGVEHRMLAHVGEIAVERGRKFVRVPLTAGPRNQPAIQFFESVAEHAVPDLAAQVVSEAELELPSDVISVLEFPNGQYVSPKEDTSPPGKIQEERKAVDGVDYQQIADRCNTSQCIGEFIQKRRREQQGSSLKFAGTPPQDELQERIARIWCDLLGLESIGIEQDFFDLGGHSLLAVQLLSRIHQELGTDLPDSVIYGDKLRIDNLARTIELQRLGVSDQVTYEAMLAEIESLSDEEVAMLLAAQEEQE
jgi:acyl carrier protein